MDPADKPGLDPADLKRKGKGRPLLPAFVTAVLAVGAVIAFGLYEIVHPSGKQTAHVGLCATSLDLASEIDPLARGELAALMPATKPNPLDQIAFDDADGRRITIASFAGKTILLNLWATWCAPCRAEMPALDALQAKLGSNRFSVVPVNVDTVRLEKPRAFLKEIKATSLPYYADSSADLLQVLKKRVNLEGLPTTVLIGPDSCEIATIGGPAAWNSPDAHALIERAEQRESLNNRT